MLEVLGDLQEACETKQEQINTSKRESKTGKQTLQLRLFCLQLRLKKKKKKKKDVPVWPVLNPS